MDSTMSLTPSKPSSSGINPALGCVVAAGLAVFFLFFGLVLGIGMGGASGAEKGLKETLLDGEETAEKKIAVIPVQQPINTRASTHTVD